MNNDIMLYPPNKLSAEDERICISLIYSGGAILSIETIKDNLPKSVVAVMRDGQEIVGVGAIKPKRPYYASTIADKDQSGFPLDKNAEELGYVSVKKSHRGKRLSHKIMEALLSSFQGRSLFATTSNKTIKDFLIKNEFVKKGKEWKKEKLSLWVKDAVSSKQP
jgi:predicted GNAT family N-acyltransferase